MKILVVDDEIDMKTLFELKASEKKFVKQKCCLFFCEFRRAGTIVSQQP